MADLYWGLTLLAVVSAVLFFTAWRVSRSTTSGRRNLLALFTVQGILLYAVFVWQNVWLATLLPYSNLIILGNWFPPATGVMAGLVCGQYALGSLRRHAVSAAILSAGLFAAVYPLLGSVPRCGDVWHPQGFCLQTTDVTCSPACAATLLKHHGIAATEQEMAELCLTRGGTSWQGLYRGLAIKTEGTPWRVEVFHGGQGDLPDLRNTPLLLRVGLGDDGEQAAAYRTEWGFKPGVSHSVLVTAVKQNVVDVTDPAPDIGAEQWPLVYLRKFWRGDGFRLVPRSQEPAPQFTSWLW